MDKKAYGLQIAAQGRYIILKDQNGNCYRIVIATTKSAPNYYSTTIARLSQ